MHSKHKYNRCAFCRESQTTKIPPDGTWRWRIGGKRSGEGFGSSGSELQTELYAWWAMECTHPNEMQPGLELVLAHTQHTQRALHLSHMPPWPWSWVPSSGGLSWPGHKPGTELCLCVQMFVIYSVLSFKIKTHLFSLPSAVFRQRKSDASRKAPYWKAFLGMAPRGLSSGLYNTISIRVEIPTAVVRGGRWLLVRLNFYEIIIPVVAHFIIVIIWLAVW